MKIIHFAAILIFSGCFLSCATTSRFSPGMGNKYKYTFKLASPAKNSKLAFQDDSIKIQFMFDEAALQFQLQNISRSTIFLDWDKALLRINGMYFPVRHATNFYGDTLRANFVVMPPSSRLRDIVIPRNNIYINGNKWAERDLLPTIDHKSPSLQKSIQQSVGQRIGLMLPMIFGSTAMNYEFEFQVDSVKRIAWKDYMPLKREPAPPNPRHPMTALDNVTAAVIVVGVLGFSAYTLSLKKNPPTE